MSVSNTHFSRGIENAPASIFRGCVRPHDPFSVDSLMTAVSTNFLRAAMKSLGRGIPIFPERGPNRSPGKQLTSVGKSRYSPPFQGRGYSTLPQFTAALIHRVTRSSRAPGCQELMKSAWIV
jgi:hypothetical protein